MISSRRLTRPTLRGLVPVLLAVSPALAQSPSTTLADGGVGFANGSIQFTAAGGAASVEDTGRFQCFKADGFGESCEGTGRDGEIRAGVQWPTPRFRDNGNGTFTDVLTGLVWLQDADCFGGTFAWSTALDKISLLNNIFAASPCPLSYNGTFSDWRLPNLKELQSLALWWERTSPGFLTPPSPFESLGGTYWSSTTFLPNKTKAWIATFDSFHCCSYQFLDRSKSTDVASVLAVRGPILGGQPVASLVLSDGGMEFPDGTVQSTAVNFLAPVERTGQTECWNSAGTQISCVFSGHDGEDQAGVAWPGPRFADNGDGTVTDLLTGLVWLQAADCLGNAGWLAAHDLVAPFNAGTTACTNYTAGTFSDWRIPNVNELLSLIDYGRTNPALADPHPFLPVPFGGLFWSSTGRGNTVASVSLSDGYLLFSLPSSSRSVWVVRGGQ